MSEDELTALALSADPDTPVGEDAVSLFELQHDAVGQALLPDWYMPPVADGRRHLTGWRRQLVLLLIVAFIAIDAFGLCSTYGWTTWA